MKNVVVYNQVGCFVGPTPASGYHFISNDGVLNNDTDFDDSNMSLVFPILRVQSVGFSVDAPRTNIRSLGSASSLNRPILSPSDVTLNIDYTPMGVINEMRFGLIVNHQSGKSGKALYGNGRVSPISGLTDRKYNKSNDTSVGWPLTSRDGKNIFIATRKDNLDFNDKIDSPYKMSEVDVMAFGDCYLTSYETVGSVKNLPRTSVSFIGSNIQVYASGSGCNIPSLNPKNYTLRTGVNFCIPSTFEGNDILSALTPQNIQIDISGVSDMSFSYNDVKIQNYSLKMSLNRTPLQGIGYRLPLDRQITFPVIMNASVGLFPGDSETGSMINLIKKDQDYNITIKLNYQSGNQMFTAIRYELLKAKFDGSSFNQSIDQYKTTNLNFSTELDPKNTTRGWFVSGMLNIPYRSFSDTFLATNDLVFF